MDFKMRLSLFCCAAACLLTVSIPLVAEATYGGRGGAAGLPPFAEETTPSLQAPLTTAAPDRLPPTSETVPPPPVSESEEESAPLPERGEGFPVSVLDKKTGEILEMELEDYIACVVAAEMPYTFNSEALKAQAVAARSYCLYKIVNGSGHDGADVCTDYSHCASFITEESLTEKYGKTTAGKIVKKVGEAVRATAGQILLYKGKPALALFHSRSYQYTESSKNVWGGDLPYLVPVSTPEEDSVSTVTVSEEEMKRIFSSDKAVPVAGASPTPTLTSEKNDSGRQASLFYMGNKIKAKSLRSLLGLRSCRFEFQKVSEGWLFTVHGYGHGVGMSQYGANQMAIDGSGYEEILLHYYTGVEIGEVSDLIPPEK